MVAEPATLAVERDDEKIRPRKRVEPTAGVVGSQEVVAERRAQSVEHRRPREKPDVLRRQAGDALGFEVLRDEPVLPAPAPPCGPPVEREGCEARPRRPALHLPPQGREAGRPYIDPEVPQQELLLAVAERKIGGPQLEETARGACAGDRLSRTVRPPSTTVEPCRHVLGESGDEGERAARAQQVRVVEDEQDRAFSRQQRRGPGARGAPPERSPERRQEHPRIVVGRRRGSARRRASRRGRPIARGASSCRTRRERRR